MAEGSAEEEQSNTAAPASPPADLRSHSTHSSTSHYHQRDFQSQSHPYRQRPNMLATAIPPRHSHSSLLAHHIKTESDMDATYDFPLNLKNEVSSSHNAGFL